MQNQHADPQLRTAVADDADRLFDMAKLLATSATPQRGPFDKVLAAALDDPNQCLIVAEGSAGLLGYLYGLVHPAFHANGNIGWVEEIYVDSAQRGTGLGRTLMARFEDWAQETADARYIAVATRRADDFYRAIGYTQSATYFKKILH